MNIDVKRIDADGTVIAQKELTGAPNAFSSAWSFGGVDRSLAQKVGFLLGDFFLKNPSQSFKYLIKFLPDFFIICMICLCSYKS